MDSSTIGISFITSVIGGLISGLITGLFFYQLGGKQLSKEAKRLDRLSTMILRAMEESGQVKLDRDAAGEVTGLVLGKVNMAGMSTMSGSLTVEKKPAPKAE